jgi:protein-tyrosine-phosphatase
VIYEAMASHGKIRVDFICVENAGRSQMAAAFAEREREERGLDEVVEIHSSGTKPADSLHDEVVEAMAEVGIDLSGRTPKYIVMEDLKESHFMITMGCTISEFNPAHYGVESRAWDLTDPEGKDIETVRAVRDEVETRVKALFDEIEDTASERVTETNRSRRVTGAIEDALSR